MSREEMSVAVMCVYKDATLKFWVYRLFVCLFFFQERLKSRIYWPAVFWTTY